MWQYNDTGIGQSILLTYNYGNYYVGCLVVSTTAPLPVVIPISSANVYGSANLYIVLMYTVFIPISNANVYGSANLYIVLMYTVCIICAVVSVCSANVPYRLYYMNSIYYICIRYTCICISNIVGM